MSVVTNVVLCFDEPDPHVRMREIDALFPEGRGFGLTLNRRSAVNSTFPVYGGTKCLEAEIAVGAFNYLDLDGLKNHLLTAVHWEEPMAVLLVYLQQEGYFWETWRLKDPIE